MSTAPSRSCFLVASNGNPRPFPQSVFKLKQSQPAVLQLAPSELDRIIVDAAAV